MFVKCQLINFTFCCVYRVLVGWPETKRPLGRSRFRWEDNIKTDLREIWIDVENWIQLAWDGVHWRVFVNMVMDLGVPLRKASYSLIG
jgi:hypothetical protein